MLREPYILRDLDPLIGASLIGVGGSFLGGLLGGSAEKKAAQAQAAQLERAAALEQAGILENRGNLADLLYGDTQEAKDYLQRTLSPGDYEKAFGRAPRAAGFTDQQRQELADVESRISRIKGNQTASFRNRMGGSGITAGRGTTANPELEALEARRAELLNYAEGDPGTDGAFAKNRFTTGRQGLLAGYQQLGDAANARGRGILSSFDDATRTADRSLAEIEAGVDDFARQDDARIDRESDEALTQLNRRTSAALGRQGMLRSSSAGRQMATNSRMVLRDAQDRKGENADRRFGFRTQLSTSRASNMMNRATQRASIASGLSDQEYNMGREPLVLQERLLTSPINTAKGNVNYAMYVPPTSSAGAMTGAFGNVLSAQSGILQGATMSDALQSLYGTRNKAPNGTAAPNSARYME